MTVHECVSFILVDDGKVLLEHRSLQKSSDPGLINIPGGHMEVGETQRETLVREVYEELNIRPESAQFLCSLYHPTSELQLIHYYVLTRWTGQIEAHEAAQVNWYPIAQAPVAIAADQIALAEVTRLAALFW